MILAGSRLPSEAALAAALLARAPRGHVRAAEALAAAALNRLRWLLRRLGPLFGEGPARIETLLPPPPMSAPVADLAPDDAAWRAVCRRIARRALAGALADPTGGAVLAAPADATPPEGAPPPAILGAYAFYRPAPPPSTTARGAPCPSPSPPPSPPSACRS